MSNILNSAIQNVLQSKAAWCRFITGNDTGTTGSHQAGFYVPKCASPLLFDEPGRKGENKEKTVLIKWQDDFTTESCMKYYGQRTRNEYRITRFGRGFPFLQDNNVGDLLIIAKYTEEDYVGYVLSSDEDIDDFLAYFNLSPNDTNQLIGTKAAKAEDKLAQSLIEFAAHFDELPDTLTMSQGARECYNKSFAITDRDIKAASDNLLVSWIDTEYKLFECIEEKIYAADISKPFANFAAFKSFAISVLNRRKSRAGKSLEHHLAEMFTHNELVYEEQVVTEGNKKPDFIFPNGECYHNLLFPSDSLTMLAVKTSCKDRWRQVLSEADRIEHKFLFTLQPGISSNQLREMRDSKVTLVVPRRNISSFPVPHQSEISDLSGFIQMVREKQEKLPKHYLFS